MLMTTTNKSPFQHICYVAVEFNDGKLHRDFESSVRSATRNFVKQICKCNTDYSRTQAQPSHLVKITVTNNVIALIYKHKNVKF